MNLKLPTANSIISQNFSERLGQAILEKSLASFTSCVQFSSAQVYGCIQKNFKLTLW
jgi:hypothetical protein